MIQRGADTSRSKGQGRTWPLLHRLFPRSSKRSPSILGQVSRGACWQKAHSGLCAAAAIQGVHIKRDGFVGGVSSAREQDSSLGGDAGNVCLGVVDMEEGVQVRVQVEVGREEQGEGETHGKSQNEEQTQQTVNRSPWMTWRWNDALMQTHEP